jgi:excisionase family DNA binding protein
MSDPAVAQAAIQRRGASADSSLRLALAPDEAAEALSVSRDFFDEHILPELRIIRRGRRRLIPIRELESWLHESATRPLASELG